MQDRQPTKPGRIELTDVVTGEKKLYDMEMADDPTNPGTPPTKGNLLSDAAEIAVFGSILDKTVNDAFIHLGGKIDLIMSDVAQITLTVVNQSGTPIPDVYIGGVTSESGDAVKTDNAGQAVALIPEGTSTVTITGYADIENFSKTFQVTKGETYVETLQVTSLNFVKITTSGNVKFSGLVESVSYQCQGAGGGGTGSVLYDGRMRAGSGGAGGDVSEVQTFIPTPNQNYLATIGSGGKGGTSYSGVDKAGDGGNTTFNGVTANGGQGSYWSNHVAIPGSSPTSSGGAGSSATEGYESVQGVAGSNSLKTIFSSFTETASAAGGGASGSINSSIAATGGVTGGGNGGTGQGGTDSAQYRDGKPGAAGTGGGGGGAGVRYEGGTDAGNGGKGGSGCVPIRMTLSVPI